MNLTIQQLESVYSYLEDFIEIPPYDRYKSITPFRNYLLAVTKERVKDVDRK